MALASSDFIVQNLVYSWHGLTYTPLHLVSVNVSTLKWGLLSAIFFSHSLQEPQGLRGLISYTEIVAYRQETEEPLEQGGKASLGVRHTSLTYLERLHKQRILLPFDSATHLGVGPFLIERNPAFWR